jgi:CHAD domain-containing protein
MVKKSRQKYYLAKRNRQWQKELKAYCDRGDEEALHRLRVSLKKIRAIASFMTACSGSNARKDIRPIKKIFRQAGMIRDAGNQLRLLEDLHPAPDAYIRSQHHIQATASAKFIDHIKQYRRDGRKATRQLFAHVHPIKPSCVHEWYARQLINISVLLNASGAALHKARKLIKEALYVHGLLADDLKAPLRLNTNYLNELEKAIGAWHDAATLVSRCAGKDLQADLAVVAACRQAMVAACREKEAAVRRVAGEFFRFVHMG